MIYSHIIFGSIALALGPVQFSSRLRNRYRPLHRWGGRVYLVSVTTSAVAGLYAAANSYGGIVAHLGFGTLAVLWMATGVPAYLAVRKGDLETHRRWMIRNFALTFAAVTLRLWLPLIVFVAFSGDFMDTAGGFTRAYQIVSWLCWVPNLIAAEAILRFAEK